MFKALLLANAHTAWALTVQNLKLGVEMDISLFLVISVLVTSVN